MTNRCITCRCPTCITCRCIKCRCIMSAALPCVLRQSQQTMSEAVANAILQAAAFTLICNTHVNTSCSRVGQGSSPKKNKKKGGRTVRDLINTSDVCPVCTMPNALHQHLHLHCLHLHLHHLHLHHLHLHLHHLHLHLHHLHLHLHLHLYLHHLHLHLHLHHLHLHLHHLHLTLHHLHLLYLQHLPYRWWGPRDWFYYCTQLSQFKFIYSYTILCYITLYYTTLYILCYIIYITQLSYTDISDQQYNTQ